MKIAVDGRSLSKSSGGITRYTYELITILSQKYNVYVITNKEVLEKYKFKSASIIYDENYSFLNGTFWLLIRTNFLCKKYNIQLFWGSQQILPLMLEKNIYYIVTIFDFVYKLFPKTMKLSNYVISKVLIGKSIKNTNKIITISKSVQNELVDFFPNINQSKIQNIYLGNSLDIQKSDNKFIPLNQYGDYIFLLGSLEPRKNLLNFLKIYKQMYKINKKYKLIITGGDGWNNNEVFKYIKNNFIENNIVFTGYISDKEINTLFHNARLFVFPSLYEGFGLPLIEAASKCKIVASKISVFEELSEYFNNLHLLDFDIDAHEMALKILKIIEEDPNQVSTIKKNYEYLFTWNNFGCEVNKLISDLINE